MSFDKALRLHRAWQLEKAEALYSKLYKEGGNDARLSYYLGITRLSLQRNADAIAPLTQALRLDPPQPKAFRALGEAYERLGQTKAAADTYRKGVAAAPQDVELRLALSAALLLEADGEGALEAATAAISLNPQLALAHNNAGLALKMLGRLKEAEQCLIAATRLAPHWPVPALNLGGLLKLSLDFVGAESWMRKAFMLDPKMLTARTTLSQTLRELGRYDESIALIDPLLVEDPNHPAGLVLQCMFALKPVYRSEADLENSRKKYSERLQLLREKVTQNPALFLGALSLAGPFNLAYQGKEDRDLQRVYGDILEQTMAALVRSPLTETLAAAPARAVESTGKVKPRIGIVSAYFKDHSVWKIPLRGWLSSIDRSVFEVFCYHVASHADEETQFARAHCDKFVGGTFDLKNWIKLISADRCDILLYPEIGLEDRIYQLAAVRMAPVQVNGLGHPVTSGLSTVDAAFGSDLMEPADAQKSYIEQLIRLPNLGIYYERPDNPMEAATRAEYGIGEDRFVYWCPQSLFKYLPKYDDVFASIAKRAPNVQFVFLDRHSPGYTALFVERLRGSFAKFGIPFDEFCVVLPRLTRSRFVAVASLCNATLDSIGWAGFNTSMESLEHHLPVLAFQGEFMRGRHSAALMERMNIRELIADDVGQYVDIAHRLATDGVFYERMKSAIMAARSMLYRDKEYASALNASLKRLADSAVH